MNMQYRRGLALVGYSLLMVFAFLLQSVVFSSGTFFPFKLDLLSVAAVCAALFLGAERGSLFCLVTGVVYCFTGADMGPITLVVICFCGALAGGACEKFFKKNLIPCALFAALALALADGTIFLLKLYFGETRPELFLARILPGLGISLMFTVIFFPLSWLIAKIGGDDRG